MFRIWLLYLNLAAIFCLDQTHINPNREVEAFKRLFLDSLNLKSEPDMSKVNTSAEELQRMLLMYHREEELLKVSRYKSIAEQIEELRRRFMFPLPQMPLSDLHSATLRLTIHPNSSGVLHLLHSDRLVSTFNLSADQEKELDLSTTVSQWIQQPDSNRVLTVECANCQSVPSEAILDVVTRQRKKRQTKNRRSKCKRNHDCCLKKLRVNFKDIGWNWIHKPESFDFYFCKGKCRSNTLLSQNALIRSILRSRSVKVPRLCCVPKRTGSLRILHYTDSNPPELVVRKMRGMVVKSCGCL